MKILIIGAGLSGRGFIPQFLDKKDKIVFLDSNEELLEELTKKGSYSIEYYNQQESITIKDFETITWSVLNQQIIDEFDIIAISVGESNYDQVINSFDKQSIISLKPIIMFENGINPAKTFEAKLERTNINFSIVSQAAIFTTTMGDGVNIDSEYNLEMYYDAKRFNERFPFNHAIPVDDFDTLMKRKIFTYNCLSAVIAYPGYFKGYEYLAEAANDKEIKTLLHDIKRSLDNSYAKEFNVELAEQELFSQKAIDKFSNFQIKDSIDRNCRDALRKLGSEERLIGPLKLSKKYNNNEDGLLSIIANAIYYSIDIETTDEDHINQIYNNLDENQARVVSNMVEDMKRRA